MAHQESSWNPSAYNSNSGAAGLFQFMPGTAQQYGVNAYDPQSASMGAANYLSDLLKEFNGDYGKAVAAYNWGQGNLQNDINANGSNWMFYLPSETRQYLAKILGQ